MTATLAVKFDAATYERLEARIRKGDWEALVARWEFGRKLLEERGNAKRLPNGRLEQLSNALLSSRRELGNRMQFAEQYATEDEVRKALDEYGSWSEICACGMGERGTNPSADAPTRSVHLPELVAVCELKPHPRNYRHHPPEQVAHIIRGIEEHGFYGTIVVARDGTILAGQGRVNAAQELGLKQLPVTRLDCEPDDPKALKILVGDNEIANLADDDGRMLAETLKEVMHTDDLLGTGYDPNQLVNLVFNSTSRAEIPDRKAAAEWSDVEYEQAAEPVRVVISFESEELRETWVSAHHVTITKRESRTWSARFPEREAIRVKTFRFAGDCLQVCLEETDLNDAERGWLQTVRQEGTVIDFVSDPAWRKPA